MWSSTAREVPGARPGDDRPASSPRSLRGTRAPASASDVFLIADGVLPAQVQEIAEVTTTRVEPECYVPPRPGAAGAPRHRRRARRRRCTSTRWNARCRSALGRDGEPIYLNLDFLDGTRGAHVNISGISGVATKTQLRAVPAALDLQRRRARPTRHNAKALVFSVKGEDLLFLDHAEHPADDELRHEYAGSACRPSRSRRSASSPRRTPATPTGRPHVTGRAERRRRVLVDARGVLRGRAAAVRLRRRRGRAQPVHDGRPSGRQPAAARRAPAGQRRRRVTSTATLCRTYDDLVDLIVRPGHRRAPTRGEWAGPVDRRRARSTRSSAGCARRQRALRPTHPRRPGRHTGAARSTTEDQQVTVVDLHNLPERAQRFVVGVVLRRGDRAQGGRRARRPAVHDDRRAQQVRAAGGLQPDQGGAARHRRARPVTRASS